jgi:guanylate kinase
MMAIQTRSLFYISLIDDNGVELFFSNDPNISNFPLYFSPAIENAHYKFLSEEEFKQWIDEGKFLEWAEYSGNYYGTLRAEVEAALAEGKTLLKEMEVQGVRQIRETLPKEQLLTVFISAGSWDALEARIRARAPISDEEVALRRKRYDYE